MIASIGMNFVYAGYTINRFDGKLWQAILIFNDPFTIVKGLISTLITVLINKRLSPVLKGRGYRKYLTQYILVTNIERSQLRSFLFLKGML